jgi:hypothetical protein
MMQILRIRGRIYNEKIDEDVISPSDYTFQLSCVPKKFDFNVESVDGFKKNEKLNALENKIIAWIEHKT